MTTLSPEKEAEALETIKQVVAQRLKGAERDVRRGVADSLPDALAYATVPGLLVKHLQALLSTLSTERQARADAEVERYKLAAKCEEALSLLADRSTQLDWMTSAHSAAEAENDGLSAKLAALVEGIKSANLQEESVGNPEPAYRQASVIVSWYGEGSLARKNAFSDALRALSAPPPPVPTEEVQGGQDRKFRFDAALGQFVNRVSGEAIPLDEPVVIFRARDKHLPSVLAHYGSLAADEHHRQAICDRMAEVHAFRDAHPQRLKEPGITRDIRLNAAPTQAPQDVAGLVEAGAQLRPRAELLAKIDGLVNIGMKLGNGDGLQLLSALSEAAERIRADTRPSPISHESKGLVLAAAEDNHKALVLDKGELTDLITDAITDSMDMDWSSRDGARAVVAALVKEGVVRVTP